MSQASNPMRTVALLGLLAAHMTTTELPAANYDESQVPNYTLPKTLEFKDGAPVESSGQWLTKRRPELLRLFEDHVYGRAPGRPQVMRFEILEESDSALDGKATRRQARVHLENAGRQHAFDILLYIPNNTSTPAPAFLTLNFRGNHTIYPDPNIVITKSWLPNDSNLNIENNRASEASRGGRSRRWAVDSIIDRGYAIATIYAGDIDPDFDDGFENGVHALFPDFKGPKTWGTIAGWAWGLSRGLDYLESDPQVDAKRVAVMGHSRLGKTSLWAGASDPRFALVISNNSGCGGAALSRRAFGETVQRINTSFPHWFNDVYPNYNDNEDAAPVDQHQLIALAAPRPIYVASATEDQWADPKGEFLAARLASPVYELFGFTGINQKNQPAPDSPVGDHIGYHLRTGKHDVTDYDWNRYLDFADNHLPR